MTELDFDKLGQIFDSILEGWENLSPEQKSEVQNRVNSAIEDSGSTDSGDDEKSEFQRRGSAMATAGAILEASGAVLVLGVATAPVGAVLIALGSMFLFFGLIGSTISVKRAKDIGSWLSSKHPKAYAIFCNNPAIIYGSSYYLNQSGPWYLMDSCSVDGMLTAGSDGIVASGDITSAAFIPDYPSWATDSSTSSTSSGSSLVKFGLVAGAAYLIFK